MSKLFDAIVVGGGFFGCAIALSLAKRFQKIVILERESDLLMRASYANQARVHTGYHYPRSLRTAASSTNNLALFEEDYQECVEHGFTALYAIARNGSRVTSNYFKRFCALLDLPCRPAPKAIVQLFSPRLIEAVYECREYAFNADELRKVLKRRIASAGIELCTNAEVATIGQDQQELAFVAYHGYKPADQNSHRINAKLIINATYANLYRISGLDATQRVSLRHQLAEICLISVPPPLRNLGVTVMDGPYFSTMPFPPRGLHSLSHVRYTAHFTWTETARPELEPDEVFEQYAKRSRFRWMLRDAMRYLPVLADAEFRDSFFEIKTMPVDTEIDDARPILFQRDRSSPRVISILGGKIDNVFDVLKVIDREIDNSSI